MLQINNQSMSLKTFMNKLLNGTAVGVLVGLIPNAILALLLTADFFKGNTFIATWQTANVLFQSAIPALMGLIIANEFGFKGIQAATIAATTYVGSGVTLKSNAASLVLLQQAKEIGDTKLIEQATRVSNSYFTAGTGDIINTMLVGALIVIALSLIGDKLGSLNIILLPIFGALVAGVGLLMLPYVKGITTATGDMIKYFTELQPYLMSVLISTSFAFILMTPMSTVAIGLAVGLTGTSAAAASMGVATAAIVLVVHSISVNKPGVTLAIALASMKMMMPNMFRNPVSFMPMLTTAALCGLLVPLFGVAGTPASAGFGLVGFTAFFASINGGLSLMMACVVWLIVPIAVATVVRYIYEKMLTLYTIDIFKFEV